MYLSNQFLYPYTLDLVEAAGIEPASEDIQLKASTCLSPSLISFPGFRRRKIPENQPCEISLAGTKASPVHYPAGRRSSSTAGKCERNGMPLIRQRVAVVLHLIFFHLFNEEDGTSTCSLSVITSVESCSPPYK